MADTYKHYVCDGNTSDFSIPFDYIHRSYVKVKVNNEPYTNFIFLAGDRIQLDYKPPNGTIVTVYRDTPKEKRFVKFTDGATLYDDDLNLDSDQVFFILQEYLDRLARTLNLDDDQKYDALNHIIKNLGIPTANNDAANKIYVDNKFAEDIATVEQYKNQAQEAKADALTSATNAAESESNASNYENKAKDWAEKPENEEVEPGLYSARHWANKAADFAASVNPNNTCYIIGSGLPNETYTKTEADLAFMGINQAYTKAEVDDTFATKTELSYKGVQPGTVIFIPRTTPPEGYLKANGALLDRETYANLWAEAQASGALVDEATWAANNFGCYSTGDGSTTFRIPMIDGRTIIGAGQGAGLTNRPIGSSGGEEKHALTAEENGPHTHPFTIDLRSEDGGGTVAGGASWGANDGTYNGTTNLSGNGTPHNNMQPWVALLACIKY